MNYVNGVSAIFQSRCPSVAVLSPEDYTLIAEWEKQEIPFEIVAASINSMCDKLDGDDAARIKSIKFFQTAIKNNFTTWLQTGIGTSAFH